MLQVAGQKLARVPSKLITIRSLRLPLAALVPVAVDASSHLVAEKQAGSLSINSGIF